MEKEEKKLVSLIVTSIAFLSFITGQYTHSVALASQSKNHK